MRNPVSRVREELGLTRNQLCHAASMRLDALYLAEAGLVQRPQRKLLAFIQEMGYSPEQVGQEYGQYRMQLRKQVRDALKQDGCQPADG